MPRLNLHGAVPLSVIDPLADTATVQSECGHPDTSASLTPLLIDINGLAIVLARSVPSLHRDDAAGRLPAALRIGGSKRWRLSEISEWVKAGCPCRSEWQSQKRS
jgi:predicted DNA-binding transcriptional regulator AlpA